MRGKGGRKGRRREKNKETDLIWRAAPVMCVYVCVCVCVFVCMCVCVCSCVP